MSTLKLSYNNEVRRVAAPAGGELSYDVVLENARTLFPQLVEATDIQLSWKDDEEDQIFVSSDSELAEAVRMMGSGTKGYLRFDIQAKTLPAPMKEKKSQPKSDAVPGIHEGVTCDECAKTINGLRFKCSVRNDYDLCSKCEERTRDSLPFPMIKFYLPHRDPSASDIVISINQSHRGGSGGCKGPCDEKRCKEKCERKEARMKKHRGIVCDGCGARNFEGVRFKCTGRPDFDLCESCENRTDIQPYPMVKIYSPSQCPNGLSVFSSSGPEATIECDINLPHGLEFLQDIFQGGARVQGHGGRATWRERARQERHHSSPQPRHRHVRCNECGMKPIIGCRFKCTTRPDFDLCEVCEAQQTQPYPMTKIYSPDQSHTAPGLGPHHHPAPPPPHGPPHYGPPPHGPHGLFGALFGHRGPHHHGPHHGPPHGGRGGGRGAGCWQGPGPRNMRCGAGRGGKEMRKATAEAAAERARQHKECVEVESASHREKELHELEEDLLNMTMRESLSESATATATATVSTSQTEAVSYEEESKDGDEKLPQADASLVSTPTASVKPLVVSKPMARFVRDVTMPDGSKVQPCSVFVKCWRVRNDGPSAWPENCHLVNAGGDEMFPPDTTEMRIPVPSASPGEELDISVHLTAPSATGRHVGYFRLQDNETNWFGQRLWSDIRVSEDDMPWQVIDSSLTMSVHDDVSEEEEEEEEGAEAPHSTATDHVEVEQDQGVSVQVPVEASAPPPPSDEMIWARELELLAAMGFTDSEVVIPLLKEVMQTPVIDGDHPNPEGLQTVVLTLLSSQ